MFSLQQSFSDNALGLNVPPSSVSGVLLNHHHHHQQQQQLLGKDLSSSVSMLEKTSDDGGGAGGGGEGGGHYYHHSIIYPAEPRNNDNENSNKAAEESTSHQKHAMAERRRRRRINGHYDTLRRLFPHLPKRDKPTVLKEAIRRVKELKKKVEEYTAAQPHGEGCRCSGSGGGSCSFFIPSERDEVIVKTCEDDDKMVEVVMCCEDRLGLIRDLSEALRSAKAKIVKTKLATIGGRIRAELEVIWCREGGGSGGDGGGGGEADFGTLRRALKAVAENRAYCGSVMMAQRMADSDWAHLGHELTQCKRPHIYSDGVSDTLLS